MIKERSAFRIAWDTLVATLVVVSTATIPAALVFGTEPGRLPTLLYWLDFLFLSDVVLDVVRKGAHFFYDVCFPFSQMTYVHAPY